MKNILIIGLLCIVSTLNAQISGGKYLSSHKYIKTMEVLIRKDGSMRITTIDYLNRPENSVFKPINGDLNIYEGELLKSNYRIEKKDNRIILYELEESRLIISKNVIASDKKSLKIGMKELGIKSAAKLEMEALMNIDAKPVPMKREYMVQNPTSEFHEKHVCEIVFFSEKPEIGKEDPNKIRTSFTAGEAVWGVAYLPTNLENFEFLLHFNRDNFGKVSRGLYIGMDKMDNDLLEEEMPVVNSCPVKRLTEDDLKLNYVIFQVIPPIGKEHQMCIDGVDFMAERMGERVGSYKHTFEVALTNADKASRYTREEMTDIEFIKGEFEFDATTGTEGYANLSKEIANAQLMKKKLPSAVMHDAQIEYEMMRQIELYAHNKGWEVDLKKVIITLSWQVIKDDYGNIEGNYIEGDVVYSHEDGCAYMNFGFLRDYLGDGQFSEALHQYTVGPRGEISCDKL